MKRVLLMAIVAAVVIPFTARAQGKPDFSGTWTMDAAKSDPAPHGLDMDSKGTLWYCDAGSGWICRLA